MSLEFPNFIPERKHEPGVVIDECFSDENGTCLSYTVYNEDGDPFCYSEFLLNDSPEEISEFFNAWADRIEEEDSDGESFTETIENLRKEAKRVPGLNDPLL